MDRRELIAGLGGVAAARVLSRFVPAELPVQGTGFPRKADFRIAKGHTYINAAYTHPMPIVAAAAAQIWVNHVALDGAWAHDRHFNDEVVEGARF